MKFKSLKGLKGHKAVFYLKQLTVDQFLSRQFSSLTVLDMSVTGPCLIDAIA